LDKNEQADGDGEADNTGDSEDDTEDSADDNDDGTKEEDGRVGEGDETELSTNKLDRLWLDELVAIVEDTGIELVPTAAVSQTLSHVDPNPVDTLEIEL
jgi:hypothetical protein